MQKFLLLGALVLSLMVCPAQAVKLTEFDATLTNRNAYGPSRWTQNLLQLDMDAELALTDKVGFTANGRVYADIRHEIDDEQVGVELREAYITRNYDKLLLKIGKQFLNWSEMDGLSAFEVVSPRDYSEFILQPFEDTAIGQTMLNLSYRGDNGYWQLLAVDGRTHELPGAGDWYEFTASRLRYGFDFDPNQDVVIARRQPDKPLFAARWKQYRDGWEWGMQVRTGPDFEPVARLVSVDSATSGEVAPELFHAERLTYGASTSIQLAATVIRGEVAYSPKRVFNTNRAGQLNTLEEQQMSIAFGVDWNAPLDIFVNGQVLIDHVGGDHADLVRPDTDVLWSLLARRGFQNDTLKAEVRWYGSNQADGLLRSSINKNISDHWDVKLGFDFFYGEEEGYFGQYKERSRGYLELIGYF